MSRDFTIRPRRSYDEYRDAEERAFDAVYADLSASAGEAIVYADAVKIGWSASRYSLTGRFRALRTSSPQVPAVIALLRGGEPVESALHMLFGEFWIRGEWFFASPHILRFFEKRRAVWAAGFGEARRAS